MSTYETIANELKDIKVCSLDSQENTLTAKRMGIRGLPSIYFVGDGGNRVSRFEGSRSKASVTYFATSRGAHHGVPLSYYTQNPFGPLGAAKGHAIRAIIRTLQMHTYLVETHGLSWGLAALLVSAGVILSSVVTILLLSWFLAPTVNR